MVFFLPNITISNSSIKIVLSEMTFLKKEVINSIMTIVITSFSIEAFILFVYNTLYNMHELYFLDKSVGINLKIKNGE